MTVVNDSDDDLQDDLDDIEEDLELDLLLEDMKKNENQQDKSIIARRRIEEIREERKLREQLDDYIDWNE